LLEKVVSELEELSNNHKEEAEAAFLEQLKTWVKENSESELLNDKGKYLNKFIRKAEEFSFAWDDHILENVFTCVADWADLVKRGGDDNDDDDDDNDEDD